MTLSMRALLLISLSACTPSDESDGAPDVGLMPPNADASIREDASVVLLPGDGSSAEQAALTCEFLAEQYEDSVNGTYWLNPIGGSTAHAFQAYCDLESEDGPWTLVLKIDGNETTFKYDEPIWIDDSTLLTEDLAPGDGEMKNAGYSTLPFSALRVGMRVDVEAEEGDGQTRYLTIDIEARSLRQLMVRGDEHETTLGRDSWRALIPLTSLQPNCNAEGINIRHKLRFGLLGNEQDDCHTPDSFVGIGSTRDAVIAGNFAVGRWQSDNGDRRTKAAAEIWVQNLP
jgi:hypothetical protein